MFENRSQPLLPLEQFIKRMAQTVGIALLLLVASLGIGMAGYHFTDQISWLDAFVNASMILTGMGPVGEIKTTAGKLFASFYALFSGMIFITVVAVTLTPLLHRLLHKFHIDEADFDKVKPKS